MWTLMMMVLFWVLVTLSLIAYNPKGMIRLYILTRESSQGHQAIFFEVGGRDLPIGDSDSRLEVRIFTEGRFQHWGD